MLIFRERLTELFADCGLTLNDFSQKFAVPKSSLSLWLRFDIIPNTRSVMRLARAFNCSVDFLLGRSNNPIATFDPSPAAFDERLAALIAEKKISPYKTAKDLHLDTAIMTSWLHKRTLPSCDNLLLLADYFNCSADFLLGLCSSKF